MIEVDVIPEVDSVLGYNDEFIIENKTTISFSETFKVSANFLQSFILNGSGIQLKSIEKNGSILFIQNDSIPSEGYKLETFKDKIKIIASSDQGAFYGVQTLRQLMPASLENGSFDKDKIRIEAVSIKDEPKFPYRGMHLDVGRHMYSVDFIRKYIDAMAMLKMNIFHWHLTEDQGWRIEIKKYPKLQEIAAYRDETLVRHYSDQPHQFDGKKYGGYYSQEEIKDIVTYAEERFVTIIPEIEMPGHSQAAIAAYPELGCKGEQVEVAKKWGVFEEIYCTKDETFNFLEDLLDEVLELFPGKYIHIGGDEAPKTRWKSCSDCQARIKSEGLKDEHELQNYFIMRIENYLNSKGRQIIGWDEILEGGLAPNATVMSWRGTSGAVEAAKSGHNVVMTPTSHCYFDYYQSDNEDEPLAIGGYLPLEKVYNFNPIPEELSKEESKYVLGAQGNVWTEYMPTEDKVEYMTFPRMLAMSEVLWSKPEHKDYVDFVSKVENFHKRLDALDINYANHLYEIEGEMISEDRKSFYQLKTLTEGKDIRYTLDGSEPNLNSEAYTSKIPITKSTTITAAVFNNKERLGKVFSQSINYHKGVGAKITIDKVPHKAYSGSGAEGLINGISGSDSRYGDKEWLGFSGEDIEITIDLGEVQAINFIETRFHNGNGQWIYAPRKFSIEVDSTLINYDSDNEDKLIANQIKGVGQYSRFVKIKIPNYGTIPEGKQGAGNKAWTFIDEIIIN
ncbi:family 20 glycosylhydrolase [uncultured Winogradskyella sp.]|uniref:beta-N-acetylhexosaminidase n=1 Tax=uncultured Winogradskyella sp. TaxID=395353 RepID=UPI002606B89C|nr:family 20 glycosylhydrolase [uncultured Winogradskyella sp.]